MEETNVKKIMDFTLVELLVVIAVIAILAGMLLPALNSAREKGQAIACTANMKQIYTGIASYLGDCDEYMPTHRGADQTNGVSAKTNLYLNQTKDLVSASWDEEILRYKHPKNAYFCPAIRADLNYSSVRVHTMPANPTYSSNYVPTYRMQRHTGVMGGWVRHLPDTDTVMRNVRLNDILNGSAIMAEAMWAGAGDSGIIFSAFRLRDGQNALWTQWDAQPKYRWLPLHAGVVNTMFKDGSVRALKWTGRYLTDANFLAYQ